MIIITATLSFETETDRDRAVALTAEVPRAPREDEPGCLAHCVGADPVEPTHIQVDELWTDPDNLAKHFEHPNDAPMVEVLRTSGGFVSSVNRLDAADDRGPVHADARFRHDAVADLGT